MNISNAYNRLRRALWITWLLPGCLLFLLGHGMACAESEPAPAKKTTLITLDAPASIKRLIEQYITFPDQPFADVTSQAIFVRRVKREISGLLATEGYFTPEIEFTPAPAPGQPHQLNVVPGPRTRVASLSIEFLGDLADDTPERRARVQKLRDDWPLTPGKVFRSARWEDAKAALLSSVMERDYAAARITESQAQVDPETAQAYLNVVIDSGPAFRFGDLQATGLERYDLDVLQLKMPFRSGDPYRRDQLLAYQARLQNSPLFNTVAVSIEPDPALHEAVPVDITLIEAHSKRIGAGVGYSSNNGARGEINYRDYNFLGRAWSLGSLLRLEQKRQTFSARVDTLPDANHYHYTFGGRVEMTDIKNLKTFNQRADFSRIRTTANSMMQLGLNWQREERRPAGAPNTVNETLALDFWGRYRNIDDPIYVRNGYVSEMRLGGGTRHVLSERDFIRSYARHMHWWPIGARDTLHLRAEVGYTLASSRQGLPQEYLFRAGGIQSIRGYDFLSLGVREGNAIVGGRTMATGTLEYVRWFTDNWGAAAFADAGDAADRWQDFKLGLGYGGGVRWRSPAGPFALDLARRHDTGTLRFHFSIAVAF
ncbi:MAG TPA: BamA/TamA family outer membrane protein [Nitrosomonas halophila]|nr:BamA/TamA family outer membrane protein [Nitrosomonas halophila]